MWKAITSRTARSGASAGQSHLERRTYGIPFATVWEVALRLASGGLRGWTKEGANDLSGIIEASVRGLVLPLTADAVISITLDDNAQTRVDVSVRARHWPAWLGACALRTRRLVRTLDRALATQPEQVLDGRLIDSRE
jgi:hypothetical protein